MTRILIVDDKEENLYLLRALLGGHGYEVEEARHGAEALAKARMAPPQLIISDLLMPVMDGYTLLRHWKADERLRAIPFVVYTATYNEPKDEQLALSLGADAFIIKPAEPEPFIARVVEVLAKDQRGELLPPSAPHGEEEVLLKEYSEVLIRKLEEKVLQLEQANRALEQDIAERTQAREALRRLNRTLRTISEGNQTVVRAASEPELLQAICRIVVEHGGYRMAWVGFAEADEAKTVRPVAHAGVEEGYLDALHITYTDTELGHGPPGTAIREGQVYTCRDILSDPRFAPWRDEARRRGYGSSIALPLLGDGKAFGALNIYSARPDAFDAEEERLLTELANDLAYGITALRTRAERERAEAALRESEERFRALVDQSLTGIGVIQDNQFVYVNPRLAETAGYQQDEMLSIPPIDLVAEADREVFRENLRRRLSGETRSVHYTFRARRKDATEIVVEAYGSLVAYNGRPAVMSTLLDITERKRAEEKVLEQLDELRRWQVVMLGRSDRSQELKREVNELLRRLGEPIRYPSQETK